MLQRVLLRQKKPSAQWLMGPRKLAFQKLVAPNHVRFYAQSNNMFNKILIANRGEIACRVMRTAKKLGIDTVAVYSVADKNSQFVKMATEAYCIGGPESKTSYLNQDLILQIAKQSGAQAIHPGYGFLSENADFAAKCEKEGVVFIGPPAKAINAMGSKSESKEIMINAKVPVVPGYHGENQDDAFLLSEAKKIGFPVLIKAVKGGGGKGMKLVYQEEEFFEQLDSARREAEKSFSDTRVLLEKYIIRPRHIEFQVFGDTLGNYVYLFERDCSVQRRHQKVIEEAPSPGLAPEKRKQMGEAAVAAARAVGYFNAGTVEFIVDQDDNNSFYFMEMNTRLQVEHPVTEMITKQDLVEWQLKVASGDELPLRQADLRIHGHAFEARIYAENPDNNFLPQTGTLYYLKPPREIEDSVRVETGVVQGDAVSIYYDPMIAKLVVWNKDRTSSLRLLKNCLDDYHVAGLPTNIEFLKKLCLHPEFIKANVETHFIQKHHDSLLRPKDEQVKVPAQIYSIASIATVLHEQTNNAKRLYSLGDPTSPFGSLNATRLNLNFQTQLGFTVSGTETKNSAKVVFDGEGSVKVNVDQTLFEVTDAQYNLQSNQFSAFFNGEKVTATVVIHDLNDNQHFFIFSQYGDFYHLVAEKVSIGSSGQSSGQDGNSVKSPMHGKIVKVSVKEGDHVKKGQTLLILEAMKMEHTITAPADGKIARLPNKPGDMVNGDQILAVIQ